MSVRYTLKAVRMYITCPDIYLIYTSNGWKNNNFQRSVIFHDINILVGEKSFMDHKFHTNERFSIHLTFTLYIFSDNLPRVEGVEKLESHCCVDIFLTVPSSRHASV